MDDTTRGVGPGDGLSGRGDETTRSYASESDRPAAPAARSARRRSAARTADDDLDPDSARRARRIEGEIAETRAELSETIDALQEKLRPGNLVSDATEKVKTATTEKVKSMADTASETAQGVMRETRERAYDFVEGARQNPVPALMIGAGVAWLLMGKSRRQGAPVRRTEWSEYASPRYGAYPETDDYYSRSAGRGSGSDRVGRAGSTTEELSEWVRDAGTEARLTARRAQNGVQRMLRQNPLLVGAAAMLVGAAVGASLPETERENEWMGETRDNVVERAQEAARDAATAVRDVAQDVVGDTVGKVADRVTTKS